MLLQAATEAAAGQRFARGALYVVATPIGNLADLTLRAVHVLASVHGWACEDTRTSATLMQHLGLDKPLIAVHEHNEAAAAAAIVPRLAEGQSLAYVSDAGTPGVSDPGARLVAAVRSAGHPVVPIPGPSAALAALSVAGDVQGHGFRFVGFLPAKGAARREALQQVLDGTETQVLFEAPHRIDELAAALADAAPGRHVTLCRELTKQFETVHGGLAGELPAWLAGDANRRRGEFVLVLHALPPQSNHEGPGAEAERVLALLLEELPLKQAVALAARISGAPRNALYEMALARRDQR